MRYHQLVRSDLKKVARDFFSASPVDAARVYRVMRAELILSENEKIVLPEPVPVHILGQEPAWDLWLEIGLRDMIARAWHREDRHFSRPLEREG